MIESLVNFSVGKIGKVSETNKRVKLSDGKWVPKSMVNLTLNLKRSLLQNNTVLVDIDERIARKQKQLDAINSKIVARVNKDLSFRPLGNMRYVIGFTGIGLEKTPVILFWNGQCPNSHTDLVDAYRNKNDIDIHDIAGGFYVCGNHNGFYENKIKLFGFSDSYGGLSKQHLDVLGILSEQIKRPLIYDPEYKSHPAFKDL